MEPRFEDALRRLEAIVEEMEQPAVPLDRALALFEDGIAQLRSATDSLTRAEEGVKVLVARAGGILQLTELKGG